MNNVLKAGNSLAQKLLKQFGQLPDANFEDDHVDLFIPRESITESGNAVGWLNELINDMEKDERNTDSKTLNNLKTVYFIFRDCSLLARYQLGQMDAHSPAAFRGQNLMIRFKMHPKNPNVVMMDVGAAIPRDAEKGVRHDNK